MNKFQIIGLIFFKIAILLMAICLSFRLGKIKGINEQRKKNWSLSLPEYVECHNNFKLLSEDIKRQYGIRDIYSALVNRQ